MACLSYASYYFAMEPAVHCDEALWMFLRFLFCFFFQRARMFEMFTTQICKTVPTAVVQLLLALLISLMVLGATSESPFRLHIKYNKRKLAAHLPIHKSYRYFFSPSMNWREQRATWKVRWGEEINLSPSWLIQHCKVGCKQGWRKERGFLWNLRQDENHTLKTDPVITAQKVDLF